MKKEIKDVIKEHLFRSYATHKDAAEKWDITRQYLSKIVNGHAPPTKVILDEIGYEKTTTTTTSYRKVRK